MKQTADHATVTDMHTRLRAPPDFGPAIGVAVGLVIGPVIGLAMILALLFPASLQAQEDEPPDIVFIILDDAGIDQLTLFGNGGVEPPATPNIDAIAAEGMRFTNAWATPECSPSRSAFFTGRWGIRTGVTTALIPNMLPQAQVSPYEVTLPRLLRTAGYRSAMMGKYHLGNNNPSGSCSPATRGFDFFRGNMEAGPPAIDSQAGLESVPPGTYDCGFVRSEDGSRAPVTGACYYPDESCQAGLNGKQCLQSGGVLVAGTECQAEIPAALNFDRSNGYYVWPETINDGSQLAPAGCTTPGAGCAGIRCPIEPASEPGLVRDYMSESQTDSGIEWWHQQDGPRMLTVSYNSIHTPYQQPPTDGPNQLLGKVLDTRQCQGDEATRFADTFPLINAMFSSADREIAILLHELGLASLDEFGRLDELLLDEMNTMLVIVGDNGSFAPSVRLPYDPSRAKGSVFQTGVLVPLIVAGPRVQGETGRETASMVNVADLYQLFAEFAGIDVRSTVPPAHRLDSVSIMPLLESADAPPVRSFNYAEVSGDGTLPTPVDPDNRLWPCVLLGNAGEDSEGNAQISGGFCSDFLFDTQAFCQTNGGLWFGPGTDYPNPDATLPDKPEGAWGSCCSVYQSLVNPDDPFLLTPASQKAVQNEHYKLVELTLTNCDAPVDDPKVSPPYERITAHQFYDLDVVPVDYLATEVCRAVDNLHEAAGSDLRCNDGRRSAELPNGNACANAPECLAPFPELFQGFSALQSQLNAVVQSATQCPGDGNQDMRVTQLDIDGVANFMGSGPSYFDFNRDGQTDEADLQIAMDNLGTDCLGACRRADLDGDNIVTREDALLLKSQYGLCDGDLTADPFLCAGDINGNGRIGRLDFQEVKKMQRLMDGEPCPVVVQGRNDPVVDAAAIQDAIDLASLDPGGGRVLLQGEFDMGGCSACVKVHGPMILEGAVDPSGAGIPTDPATAIISNAGIAPIIVFDSSRGDGRIRISNLWFKGGRGRTLEVVSLEGRIEFVNNRISGYSSFSINGTDIIK